MQLLKTKLHNPPIRPDLVPRPTLMERLNAGLHRKLTLVSAPAGSGKTTLISAWLHSSDRASTWLSLDEGDNDPVRFFAYLIAALQVIQKDTGNILQRLLETAPAMTPESMATILINDLEACEPFVLVLDDYHAVSEPAIHGALAFLLERQPARMHLAVTTRHDPPLPLSRLRGRNQLTEIRQPDLRFSREETAVFLHQATSMELGPTEIATLEQRTEGWVTGLQLAALALQGHDRESVARTIRDFSGQHHFVLDYLADEVLMYQPQALQGFLLQTSILERMCGALCDAIMDAGDWRLEGEGAPSSMAPVTGQETLHQLESGNLFVVPLNDERTWYRYHGLFSDLLRARLQEGAPGRVPELHRRAAAWYEANELPAEAVHHALASGDSSLAASTIERAITQVATWSRIEVATLLGWLRALPSDIRRTRPRLELFAARALFSSGQTEAASHALDDLEASLRVDPSNPDAEQVLRTILADRGSYAVVYGEVQQAEAFTLQFLDQVEERDTNSQIRAAATLGMAYYRSGNLSRAGQAFTQAIRITRAEGMTFAAVPLVCNLAEVQLSRGKLRLATQTLGEAMEMGTVNGTRTSLTGFVWLELGKILYEQNDLPAAEQHLLEALELLDRGGIAEAFGSMHALLARVKQAQGDTAAAQEAIQLAVQTAQGSSIPRLCILAAAYQAQIWLAQGKVALARQWAHDYRQVGETQYLREFEDLTLAQVLLDDRQPDEALALLDELLPKAEAAGRMDSVIKCQALRALALQAIEMQDQAFNALTSVLPLAEPEGYVRTFVDCGRRMCTLLEGTARHGIAPAYIARLVAAFEYPGQQQAGGIQAPHSGLRKTTDPPLVEPLTNREMEVLHLLAEGLSNAEIMGRLVISLPTVKSHTRNIYGKLDVHDRKAAVHRARELGIIPH